MKKYLLMLMIICVYCINGIAYADYEMNVQELPEEASVLVNDTNTNLKGIALYVIKRDSYRFITVKDKQYLTFVEEGMPGVVDVQMPVKISGEHISSPNCIWTGQYYFCRGTSLDGYWLNPGKYAEALTLMDEEGETVKRFGLNVLFNKSIGQHADKIGYLNGTYYAHLRETWENGLVEGKVIKSTDFENWEVTDEEVPAHIGNIIMAGEEIAVPNADLASVVYEDDKELELFYTLGDWIINRDNEDDFYISNDNTYFVKLNYPELLKQKDEEDRATYKFKGVYEYKDDIVIDLLKTYREKATLRLTAPKQEIYRQLDEMKNAPYVKYQDNLLAFETPPAIEDGSTLVPMRFLLEQMGADVEWNGETQTVTAMLDNTAVTFAIDDINAEVNNELATMDVPARLINGKTMVPLRFLSEEMGFDVDWDADSRTAIVQ